MDNVNIEIIGYGVDMRIGTLTNLQMNYILSHQLECNTIIPLLNNDSTISYNDWTTVNDVASIYGASYKNISSININVNGINIDSSNINEEFNEIVNDTNLNHLLSIQHLNGTILNYNFSVSNFDINQLTLLVTDASTMYWGEVVSGVKYNNELLTPLNLSVTNYTFENLIVKGTLVNPILKI